MGKYPCTLALAATRVPAVRFGTRVDLLALLERAKDLIEADPAADIDLEGLGREVGLSPYHLQRSFKQVYSRSPHALRQDRRLEMAKKLLESGHPVGEACLICGFSSASAFGKLFRRKFGLPPSRFRSVGVQ